MSASNNQQFYIKQQNRKIGNKLMQGLEVAFIIEDKCSTKTVEGIMHKIRYEQ